MRSVLLVALLVLLGGDSASASFTGFYTPHKRVGCAYTVFEGVRNLRCDVLRPTNPQPEPPASCEYDWGPYFGMTARSRARRLCVSDTPLSSEFGVLGYGHTRRLGPFTCRSRRANLRCTNRAGHGFALSRVRQRLL
jgi:hypothetical protein